MSETADIETIITYLKTTSDIQTRVFIPLVEAVIEGMDRESEDPIAEKYRKDLRALLAEWST